MARAKIEVRSTVNFERNLADIEAFFAESRASHAYGELLDMLAGKVIPNLGSYPRLGRPFAWDAHSIQAQERMSALPAAMRVREFREYVSGDYLILYECAATTVFLLAIKHHRQLSFDLDAHWMAEEPVASYAAMEKQRRRRTLEALADVKAGRTHAHATVQSWAATLRKPKRESRR